jgi:hypothetical protein
MATPFDYPDPLFYRRRLSGPLSELLADPFSELTRKRQTPLLIAASVTFLLSAGILTVQEADVGSIKFHLEVAQLAKGLAFWVTIYLLAAFVLGVRADWVIAKAKQLSPLASTADVMAAMKADTDAEFEAVKARAQRRKVLQDKMDKIQAEAQQQLDVIFARQRDILRKISSTEIEEAPLHPELLELENEQKLIRQQLEDRLSPLQTERDELFKRLAEPGFLDPAIFMTVEREEIKTTLKTFSNLTRARLYIEALFPAIYAMIALACAVAWTLHHG